MGAPFRTAPHLEIKFPGLACLTVPPACSILEFAEISTVFQFDTPIIDPWSAIKTMKLSKRSEYGLRALIYLATALESPLTPLVQIREIAERQNIPNKFLEQILLSLKNAGLLRSKMGVGGGYYLARPAETITIGQVIRALEGPLGPTPCASRESSQSCDCPDLESCGVRMIMQEVHDALSSILDCTTLADLARRSSSLGGFDRKIG